MNRKLQVVLMVIMLAISMAVLAACRNNDPEPAAEDPPAQQDPAQATPAPADDTAAVEEDGCPTLIPGLRSPWAEVYVPPYRYTVGTLTISGWNGWHYEFLRDIGRRDIAPEDVYHNRGTLSMEHVITARLFNERFPNVEVNSKVFERSSAFRAGFENFELEHGVRIDIFPDDGHFYQVERGMVADLSIFRNDPVYHQFNPALMDLFRLNGRTFAIPRYVIPNGVFVNMDLAEQQNIDVPPVDWNIYQFDAFVRHSAQNQFYGLIDLPWRLIDTMAPGWFWQMNNRGPNDPFVSINNDATRHLLSFIPGWADHAVNAQRDRGNVDEEWFTDTNSNGWSWDQFAVGRLLAHATNQYMPWEGAMIPGHPHAIHVQNWDIFPVPSIGDIPNHIRVSSGGMSIRNFAMDDGNPELSYEEYLQMQLAWEFLKIRYALTEYWEAMRDFYVIVESEDGTPFQVHATEGSLSFVTGDAFHEQMEIWRNLPLNRPLLGRPGFARVVELFEEGTFTTFPNSFPERFDFEGDRPRIDEEWRDLRRPAGTEFDARVDGMAWYDSLISLLPEWDRLINERFESAFESVPEFIDRWYGVNIR